MTDGDIGRVSEDRPRLLAARSEFGYVDVEARALPAEPEAVSALEQERQTKTVHRQEEERRKTAWRSAHSQIDGALQQFEQEGHPDPRTRSDTRAIARTARRIDERLGLP